MDIIEEAAKYAISEVKKHKPGVLPLFTLSTKKGLELAKKLGGDEKIVHLGLLFMDIKLPQASKEGRPAEHVEMSAKAAEEFLDKYDISQEEKKKVINCVATHHKKVPFECLEAEICANADCYKFIHPKGFFTYLTILGGRDADPKDALAKAEAKLDEKHDILSLDVCKEELEDVYNVLKKLIKKAKEF